VIGVKETPAAARTAIVTGGTAGIGFAVAEALLMRGHSAFICGRDTNRLDGALHRLGELKKSRMGGAPCDVRSLSSVEIMVTAAERRIGKIDTLINCAGMAFITPFEDITSEQWCDIIATNLTGVFNCCKAVLPLLRRAARGDIVNLGSRSGRYAFRGGAGYNTTKFGLQGFTEALFLDLNVHGIRVSLVAPGTVATSLMDTPSEDWHLQPSDVAKVVVDLLEADARAAINWVEIRPARPPAS
jgi:NAD(P)-dependent dehydrogenase (short-subunit alcohol dehydrogenase family)